MQPSLSEVDGVSDSVLGWGFFLPECKLSEDQSCDGFILLSPLRIRGCLGLGRMA